MTKFSMSYFFPVLLALLCCEGEKDSHRAAPGNESKATSEDNSGDISSDAGTPESGDATKTEQQPDSDLFDPEDPEYAARLAPWLKRIPSDYQEAKTFALFDDALGPCGTVFKREYAAKGEYVDSYVSDKGVETKTHYPYTSGLAVLGNFKEIVIDIVSALSTSPDFDETSRVNSEAKYARALDGKRIYKTVKRSEIKADDPKLGAWKSIKCSILPIISMDLTLYNAPGTTTPKAPETYSYDPPVPWIVSPIALKERYAAEIQNNMVWDGIKVTRVVGSSTTTYTAKIELKKLDATKADTLIYELRSTASQFMTDGKPNQPLDPWRLVSETGLLPRISYEIDLKTWTFSLVSIDRPINATKSTTVSFLPK